MLVYIDNAYADARLQSHKICFFELDTIPSPLQKVHPVAATTRATRGSIDRNPGILRASKSRPLMIPFCDPTRENWLSKHCERLYFLGGSGASSALVDAFVLFVYLGGPSRFILGILLADKVSSDRI